MVKEDKTDSCVMFGMSAAVTLCECPAMSHMVVYGYVFALCGISLK